MRSQRKRTWPALGHCSVPAGGQISDTTAVSQSAKKWRTLCLLAAHTTPTTQTIVGDREAARQPARVAVLGEGVLATRAAATSAP